MVHNGCFNWCPETDTETLVDEFIDSVFLFISGSDRQEEVLFLFYYRKKEEFLVDGYFIFFWSMRKFEDVVFMFFKSNYPPVNPIT